MMLRLLRRIWQRTDTSLYWPMLRETASRQVSQIQEMLEQQVAAFIITPVDAYGLTDVLAEVKEAEIPVFSYDDLIMDTNAVKYYTTFGGRQAGQMIAEEIIKKGKPERSAGRKGNQNH